MPSACTRHEARAYPPDSTIAIGIDRSRDHRGDHEVAAGNVLASEPQPREWVLDERVRARVVDDQVRGDQVEGARQGLLDDPQVFRALEPGGYRDREVLGLLVRGEKVDLVDVEDRRPRPGADRSRRAVALVGVEVDHEHALDQALGVHRGGGDRDVGVDAEAVAPRVGGVVVSAREVDRQAVLERHPAGQQGPAGRVPHRPQHPPVDERGRQPGEDRHAQDLGEDLRAAQRAEILDSVDPRQLVGPDRLGPEEIDGPTQAVGDQRVVDAAVLQAVEGMQPLQSEDGDIIAGMVDDRDHEKSAGSAHDRDRRAATSSGRLASARDFPS